MWCDAICINQRDNDEKSAQVKQMLLIFSKARKVLAWLGNVEPDIEAMLRSLGAPARSKSLTLHNDKQHQQMQHIHIGTSGTLDRLLKRPWFSGTWIRQEVYAARVLILQIGHIALAFEDFLQLAERANGMTP